MKVKRDSVLISILALLMIVPLTTFAWYKGNDAQKEDKVEAPSLNNQYFTQLQKYIENNIPFRGDLIERIKVIQNKIDGNFQNLLSEIANSIIGEDYFEPFMRDGVLFGRDDWLFYTGDNSLEFYTGQNLLTNEQFNNFDDAYFKATEACKKHGLNFAVLIGPNKEQVFDEFMPSIKVKENYKREMRIADHYKNSEVNYIYPLEQLKNDKVSGATYYQQDTHWNNKGAFVGYNEFMKSIGREASEAIFNEVSITGGDLSGFCGYETTYTDYSVSYKNDVVVTYESVANEIEHSTCVSGEGKLLILGDSFRNAFKGYAYKDFEEVLCEHRSQMDDEYIANYLSNFKAGDTILLIAVERYDEQNLPIANRIANILNDCK